MRVGHECCEEFVQEIERVPFRVPVLVKGDVAQSVPIPIPSPRGLTPPGPCGVDHWQLWNVMCDYRIVQSASVLATVGRRQSLLV